MRSIYLIGVADQRGVLPLLDKTSSLTTPSFELDLIPAQVHEFGSTQAVAVSHEDHRGVAVAIAVAVGNFHEPLDLSLGEVLARPQVAIGGAAEV